MGAKFATILLFGRPGDEHRLTKERAKTKRKQVQFRVSAGGGRGRNFTEGVVSPACV